MRRGQPIRAVLQMLLRRQINSWFEQTVVQAKRVLISGSVVLMEQRRRAEAGRISVAAARRCRGGARRGDEWQRDSTAEHRGFRWK